MFIERRETEEYIFHFPSEELLFQPYWENGSKGLSGSNISVRNGTTLLEVPREAHGSWPLKAAPNI